MKKNTDLVGKVVKIDEVQYLIDKVTTSDGRNNENSSANIQKFRIELITLDFLTEANQKINELVAKPIQDFVPKEKIKGIAIEFSEEQLHNKVTITKALCKAFAIGIMDAKHLVDNADSISNSRYIMHYEATFLDKSKVEAYIRKIHAELCQSLSCKPDDITISIY